MYKEKVIVSNNEGLHARPASRYLREAIKFQSEVTLIKDEVRYNGKSILSVLSMGANKGTELTIECEGEDEKVAVAHLKDFIENEL